MTLGHRRSKTSCFCHLGCWPGTYPFERYWVTSFSFFNPFESKKFLFIFQGIDEAGECTWDALDQPFGPAGVYQMKKTALEISGEIVGWRWTVFATDGTGINAWQEDYFPPLVTAGLIEPEGEGSCSRMFYEIPNVVWGEFFTATIQPAYPDACDNEDRVTKVQTKQMAPY